MVSRRGRRAQSGFRGKLPAGAMPDGDLLTTTRQPFPHHVAGQLRDIVRQTTMEPTSAQGRHRHNQGAGRRVTVTAGRSVIALSAAYLLSSAAAEPQITLTGAGRSASTGASRNGLVWTKPFDAATPAHRSAPSAKPHTATPPSMPADVPYLPAPPGNSAAIPRHESPLASSRHLARQVRMLRLGVPMSVWAVWGWYPLPTAMLPLRSNFGQAMDLPTSGVYVALFRLRQPRRIRVGSLGIITFNPGVYAYVGSAQRNLPARLARHARRRKPLRWHVDYLSVQADMIGAIAVEGPKTLECRLAAILAKHGAMPVPGFGCTDCRCRSHLFGWGIRG